MAISARNGRSTAAVSCACSRSARLPRKSRRAFRARRRSAKRRAVCYILLVFFFLALCLAPMLCPLVVALFGSVVSIFLTSAADAGFGLPPVADAPGALFGSVVSIFLISAADGRFAGLPPVADAPGALFGSAVFIFWATAAVANSPMAAAATIGIRRIFGSIKGQRRGGAPGQAGSRGHSRRNAN